MREEGMKKRKGKEGIWYNLSNKQVSDNMKKKGNKHNTELQRADPGTKDMG